MGIIKLLDRNTIDKIAAGEVIERPLSIVKELVENSIDAAASRIEIEIKKGGKSYIRISDNGNGIMAEDMDVIFQRHATSKIACIEDLYESCALGFRGEALSSISAVADVSLTSKHKDEDIGSTVRIKGGLQGKRELKAAPQGTEIIVEDLFFNTPVRKKFLKSDVSETAQISDIIERLALSRPDISFNYISNGKQILQTSGFDDLKEVIFDIYGKDVYTKLLPIDESISIGHISGYIGMPAIARGSRNRQSIFINNRYIKSFLLMKAVQEAYSSFLMQHQYPFFVLRLSIDPSCMDVNVHPSKMEVSFENSSNIYRELYHAVRNRLLGINIENLSAANITDKPKLRDSSRQLFEANDDTVGNSTGTEKLSDSDIDKPNEGIFGSSKDSGIAYIDSRLNAMIAATLQAEKAAAEDMIACESQVFVSTEHTDDNDTVSDTIQAKNEYNAGHLPAASTEKKQDIQTPDKKYALEEWLDIEGSGGNISIIGQIFDTYIIAQIDDMMYIVDQHAAHEKINFERLMRSMNEGKINSQQLLKPAIINLSAKEELALGDSLPVLRELGFEIEGFGGRSYSVRAVPGFFFGLQVDVLLVELLDRLSGTADVGNIELIKDRIADVACKSSIRAGRRLSDQEARHLIKELLELDAPFNCPHGRPTMISMSRRELEKKFKRIL